MAYFVFLKHPFSDSLFFALLPTSYLVLVYKYFFKSGLEIGSNQKPNEIQDFLVYGNIVPKTCFDLI